MDADLAGFVQITVNVLIVVSFIWLETRRGGSDTTRV